MGNQIIRQPDGFYAVFSSIVDGFTALNCTRQEIINSRIEEERERIRQEVNATCDKIDNGEPAYFQFGLSWDEAVEINNEKDENEKVVSV